MIWKNGAAVPMTDSDRQAIAAANKQMADRALRVLMAAMCTYDAMPSALTPEAVEHDLCFIGLEGMIDPVRPEVKAAHCRMQ